MPITAGLWTSPLPSALVSTSFPYSKSFFVYDRIWYSVLVMEVKTGYDQAARSMSVQINGTELVRCSHARGQVGRTSSRSHSLSPTGC